MRPVHQCASLREQSSFNYHLVRFFTASHFTIWSYFHSWHGVCLVMARTGMRDETINSADSLYNQYSCCNGDSPINFIWKVEWHWGKRITEACHTPTYTLPSTSPTLSISACACFKTKYNAYSKCKIVFVRAFNTYNIFIWVCVCFICTWCWCQNSCATFISLNAKYFIMLSEWNRM